MYKKSFVSVSFTPNKILILQLDAAKKVITKYASIDLPQGIITNYRVRDIGKLTEIIKAAWKQHGIHEHWVGLVIPEFSTYTKTMMLPHLETGELDEAVRWQAQEFLPESGKDMVLDWKILKTRDSQHQILVVSIPQDILAGYVQAMSDAGLYPIVVETPSLSLVRIVTEVGGPRLIIYSNLGEAILILAEGEKIIGSIVAASSDQEGILRAALNIVRHYADTKPEKIFIGGLQISQSLVETLKKELAIPIEWMKSQVAGLDTSRLQEYLVPLSLQLKDPSEPSDENTINLLPPNWVKQYENKKFRRQVWTLFTVSTAVIVACLVASIVTFIALKTQINALTAQSQDTISQSKELESDITDINTQATKVNKIMSRYVTPSTILNSLVKAIVPGITLKRYTIDFEQGLVNISGLAINRASLLAFKKSLDEKEDFGSVSLPLSSLLTQENINFDLEIVYVPLQPKKSGSTLKVTK